MILDVMLHEIPMQAKHLCGKYSVNAKFAWTWCQNLWWHCCCVDHVWKSCLNPMLCKQCQNMFPRSQSYPPLLAPSPRKARKMVRHWKWGIYHVTTPLFVGGLKINVAPNKVIIRHNTAFKGIGSEANTSPGMSSMWYSNKVVGSTPQHSSRYLWPWFLLLEGSTVTWGIIPVPTKKMCIDLEITFMIWATSQLTTNSNDLSWTVNVTRGVWFSTPWWVHTSQTHIKLMIPIHQQ